MLKRLGAVVVSLFMLFNIYGCAAAIIGVAAGAAGTAIWLSGKLSHYVNVPFDDTVDAAKSALKSMNLKINKVTVTGDVAQIMSEYTDGETIWVDIRREEAKKTKIEVRVGAAGNKEASYEIMNNIIAAAKKK